MQVIQDQILGAAASPITFQNIPQNFVALRLVLSLRDTAAGTVQAPYIRFNNDSGNNYSQQAFSATGSGSGGAGLVPVIAEGVSGSRIGRAPAASAVANSFSQIVIDIYDYTSALKLKTFTAQCGSKEAASAGMNNETDIGVWSSVAAINRLDVFANATFAAGSRATLFGIAATNFVVPAGQPSSPTILFDTVLASPAAVFNIDGIPSGYRSLKIHATLIPGGTDRTYIDVGFHWHPVGPGGGIYFYNAVGSSRMSGAVGGGNQNGTQIPIGTVLKWAADGIFPWMFVNMDVLEGYDAATRHGCIYDAISHQDVNGNTTDISLVRGGAYWRTSGTQQAITGFDFTASTQTFDTGSRIVVVGNP
jgi:hypothetical protein